MRSKLITFVALFAIAACTGENLPESGEQSPEQFRARTTAVKTTISEQTHVLWCPGDEIVLYDGGTSGQAYRTDIIEPADEAAFNGKGAIAKDGKYIAVHPSASDPVFSASSVSVTLKSSQNATSGTYDPAAGLLYAESASTDLSFSHLVAYLRFEFGQDSPCLSSIVVKSIGGEPLSGKMQIGYGVLEAVTASGSDEVSLNASDAFATGKYCIALIPGTYTKGLKFIFTEVGGRQVEKSLNGPLTLGRGDLMNMGTVRLDFAGSQTLKLMSFNIRTSNSLIDVENGRGWNDRKGGCFAMFRSQKPDVAGLNEVQADQKESFDAELSEFCLLDGAVDAEDGNYILYNPETVEPVAGKSGKFWLSPTPDVPSVGWSGNERERSCIYSQFKFKGKKETFWVFVTHTASGSGLDVYRGLELIGQRIASIVPENEPVFLTGDLNCREDSGPLLAIRGSMADSRRLATVFDNKSTYNNWGDSEGILDYIFAKGCLSPDKFETIDGAYAGTTYISDHYPVVLECRIPAESKLSVPVPDVYSDTFTSNVNLENGNIEGKVQKTISLIGGVEYTSLKIGTDAKSASYSFIPDVAGDFELSLFAFCWNNREAELKVSIAGGKINGASSVSINPRPNPDCASDVSVFNPIASDKYTFNVTGAASNAVIKISCDYRCIIFGVNIIGGSDKPSGNGSMTDPLNPRDEWQDLF